MAYIRKRLGRWQSVVRVKGYPARTQSFNSKSDARLWSSNIELELYREEHGLRKNKYPTFRECFERYRDEVVIHKRSKEMETKLIKYILTEGFVNYRIDKVVIVSAIIGDNSGLVFQYIFGTLFFIVKICCRKEKMRIIVLMLFVLLLTNCTNSSYVKNKKF